MGLKGENRHFQNQRLASAYQGSFLNAAANAARSGDSTKEGFKNFKKFLKTHLPTKGGWDLKEMKADDYSDFRDLRDTSSNPKKDNSWQLQHDILSDLHSAQGDDFKLKTNPKAPWISTMFDQKGFGMNAPFAGGGNYHSMPFQAIPIGNLGISGQLGPRGIGTGNTDQTMPGGIMNTGSFYDLAINPAAGRDRLGVGLGGYTVMS